MSDLTAIIVRVLQSVLGGSLDLETVRGSTFAELGIDSLSAVSFGSGVSRESGVKVSPTIVYDYPTVDGLAVYLASKMVVSGRGGKGEKRKKKKRTVG